MGILSGNPTDEPMHYGEVFGTWSFLSTSKGLVAGYQTFLNHVGDKDLHKLVQETIEQCQQEMKGVEKLLKENGVALPPTPPERPEACLDDIPVGARVQDPEVAAYDDAGDRAITNPIANDETTLITRLFTCFPPSNGMFKTNISIFNF
ncbi:DUF3231 family protein [Priestia megaterium]